MAGKRDRSQPQAGGPALGALVQAHRGVRERESRLLEELARLRHRETQFTAPDLRQSTRDPQAMQPEPRLRARPQRHPHSSGQIFQEQREAVEPLLAVELVEVVDHQHDRILECAELGQQPFDRRLAAESRSGAHGFHDAIPGRGPGELIDHGQPEPLPIPLAALNRDPGRTIAERLGLDPRTQQEGLAASRRRADERDAAGGHP
jgi:hypothetical protein